VYRNVADDVIVGSADLDYSDNGHAIILAIKTNLFVKNLTNKIKNRPAAFKA